MNVCLFCMKQGYAIKTMLSPKLTSDKTINDRRNLLEKKKYSILWRA